jgi:hypothetical protein
MQVLSSHRPGLYPTVPLLFTPTWPLLALSALTGSKWLGLAVASLVVVRTLLSWRLSVLSSTPPLPLGEGQGEGKRAPLLTTVGHTALDWLLGEGLLLTAFIRSLVHPAKVTWRGRTYALHAGGRMSSEWTELSGGRG